MSNPVNKGKGRGIQWLRANAGHKGEECLIWPFSKARGYGQFGHLGRVLRAHKFMCELVNGRAPSPKHEAAHSCGKGHLACVHPQHLSWKTPTENQRDRRKHGTQGNQRGKNVLNADQVADIRAMGLHRTQQEIADDYGVTRENIGRILRRKNWRA